MKILLIEDDSGIRALERDYLLKEGYTVIEASDGESGIETTKHQKPDLIVLDLNLPVVDGITVCKTIRKFSDTPILMVTAKTKEEDELKGLAVGADDYIKKPFSPRVLVSRVKALLRRPSEVQNSILKRGDLEIDLDAFSVKQNKKRIDLTKLQLHILKVMMQNPYKTFTREELLDSYPNNENIDIFPRTIDSHIKNIRKKLAVNSDKQYILTIRGIGYKFNEEI
jgi:two-component system response regulator BaeR